MSLRFRFDRAPLRVYWKTTRACDLACRAEAVPEPDPDELTTAEGLGLLERHAARRLPRCPRLLRPHAGRRRGRARGGRARDRLDRGSPTPGTLRSSSADPALVARDVWNEKITLEYARREHGVVLDPATLAVDADATCRLQATRGPAC